MTETFPRMEEGMEALGISCDGLRFEYNGYRYDRLADAEKYAILMRSRPAQDNIAGPSIRARTSAAPTVADRAVMSALAIDFKDGSYRYQEFRYDLLSDAVNYARLTQRRSKVGRSTAP